MGLLKPATTAGHTSMAANRIEILQQFVDANPNDCFSRYGIAQEHVKQQAYEKALEQFNKIFEINADYQAAYYHAGRTLEKLGRADDAAEIYRKGIEVAARSGDLHARSELEAALEELSV